MCKEVSIRLSGCFIFLLCPSAKKISFLFSSLFTSHHLRCMWCLWFCLQVIIFGVCVIFGFVYKSSSSVYVVSLVLFISHHLRCMWCLWFCLQVIIFGVCGVFGFVYKSSSSVYSVFSVAKQNPNLFP